MAALVIRPCPLTETDVCDADRELRDLAGTPASADDPVVLARLASIPLPDRLAEPLDAMRRGQGAPALLVRRPPIVGVVGPTPAHWSRTDPARTLAQDLWLLLLAEHIGLSVGWSSLQNGRLINDIIPVRGSERAQTGAGSAAELDFHVEDAFDRERCDVLLLIGIRNDDHVPTTVGTIEESALSAADLDVLTSPRFVIRPDPEHLRSSASAERLLSRLVPVPVLVSNEGRLQLRVDPSYTEPTDEQAKASFERLCSRLGSELHDVGIQPSDVLIIDNHRAVHGRRPFTARYDGNDRWLRKATVIRDAARSRRRRTGDRGRIMDPP